MAMSMLTARVDADVKARADAVIKRAGMTQTDVVRIVMANIADTGRIPRREEPTRDNELLDRMMTLRAETPSSDRLRAMGPQDLKRELEARG